MKYVTVEGMDSEESRFNAVEKARTDIEKVAEKLGYKRLNIPTVFGVKTKKWQKPIQLYHYKNNARKWNKIFNSLEKDDTILIQYPLINTAFNFFEIVKKYSSKVKVIVVVHDLESLRFKDDPEKSQAYLKRVNENDLNVLNSAYKVISHNEKMSSSLIKMGVKKEKLVNLGVFDYLYDKKTCAKTGLDDGIIIAGNLKIAEKSGFLKDLKTIKGSSFNLYGVNFDKKCEGENIDYRGAFKPDELISHLSGSFGLIWDGPSVKTCTGQFGKYLKINNPHKTSLYLASGLPIIIYKDAALAPFVEKNGLGITVKSLDEIPGKLKKITKKDYEKMLKNVEKVKKDVRTGKFFEKALKEAEK
ncbi:galactofuranosyltransferase [Candidatus Saccharibacteria bacterium]|nr:galactofuranosyltransferase [Candidatus Saccharibacteria bacterium]